MASKLILMRHGSVDNIPDPPLNFIGLTEAQMAAEKIASWKVTDVFSSPSKRCLSTAKILSKPFKKEVRVEDGLKENLHWDRLLAFIETARKMDGANILAINHANVMRTLLVNSFKVEPSKVDTARINPLSYAVIELDGAGKATLEKGLEFMFSESSKMM